MMKRKKTVRSISWRWLIWMSWRVRLWRDQGLVEVGLVEDLCFVTERRTT